MKQVHVVEELTIKAAKHDDSVGYKDSGVAAPGLRHGMPDLEPAPSFVVQIEAVEVIDVVVVPTT